MIRSCTLLARSPRRLLDHLNSLPDEYRTRPLLFALSANVEGSELSDLVSALTSTHAHDVSRVGCLSASPREGLVSCSLIAVAKEHSAAVRSTIPGTKPVQVGRWHTYQGDGAGAEDVAVDDQYIRSGGLHPKDVRSMVYMSDKSPEGLLRYLRHSYPSAHKMGLVAQPTPFVTGRPVTLFHNGQILSDGAVGFEFGVPATSPEVQYAGLVALTPALRITSVTGNLVHELNNTNPSKLLLETISRLSAKPDKDDPFVLGVISPGYEDQPRQVYGILSGDPSRGTMALDAERAPPIGTEVKIFWQPRTSRPMITLPRTTQADPSVQFIALQTLDSSAPQPDCNEEVQVFENRFVAASEAGWIVGDPDFGETSSPSEEADWETSWKCTMDGATAEATLLLD